MVRHRLHTIVTLGRFNEALDWAREMNQVLAKNGWATGRVLMPAFGKVNDMVYEREYPDLASMEREDEAFYASAEAMAVWRKGIEFNAPGTHPWDECEVSGPEQLA